MAYIKGTTPTFIFKFSNTFDCTAPSKITLTIYGNGRVLLRKDTEDLTIEEHQISVFLSQAETLAFPKVVKAQINMLYSDNTRVATNEYEIDWAKNQLDEVMT